LTRLSSVLRYVPPEYIALVYEGLGERDRALTWFEKAYAERSMNVWMLPTRNSTGSEWKHASSI